MSRARSKLPSLISRAPQPIGSFEPGDPQSGFYNDLRGIALEHGTPTRARGSLEAMTHPRRLANPVSVAQLGLGAWQLGASSRHWLPVVAAACDWLVSELDAEGRLPYLFAVPHTYRVGPPWYSAMAQGEAASLLVRAAQTLHRPELADGAARAAQSLLEERLGLIALTPEGPVLQEYPTDPPAHVLNGWISALWGLYDVSRALTQETDGRHRAVAAAAGAAFDDGARTLAARLPRYDAGLNWSRYDLFPHRIVHVASPFYHRLHIEQLQAMARLCPELTVFEHFATRWDAGARHPFSRASGLARKVVFRMLEPRKPPT
jgi:heparosan-N-sulfate-glucuronate 5-epimerase